MLNFGLGCVLFTCSTLRPTFGAKNLNKKLVFGQKNQLRNQVLEGKSRALSRAVTSGFSRATDSRSIFLPTFLLKKLEQMLEFDGFQLSSNISPLKKRSFLSIPGRCEGNRSFSSVAGGSPRIKR